MHNEVPFFFQNKFLFSSARVGAVMNNIGIGLSASMAGLPLLPAAVTTLIFSVLFLLCGNQLGQSRFLRLIGNAADPISGLLLIGLGIIQLAL